MHRIFSFTHYCFYFSDRITTFIISVKFRNFGKCTEHFIDKKNFLYRSFIINKFFNFLLCVAWRCLSLANGVDEARKSKYNCFVKLYRMDATGITGTS